MAVPIKVTEKAIHKLSRLNPQEDWRKVLRDRLEQHPFDFGPDTLVLAHFEVQYNVKPNEKGEPICWVEDVR